MAAHAEISLGDFSVLVESKDIKNIHLSVYPPDGAVRVAAPTHLPLKTIRAYVLSRYQWIQKQRKTIQAQERESPRDFCERESHYLWGKRHLLTLTRRPGKADLQWRAGKIEILTPSPENQARNEKILDRWLRSQLNAKTEKLVAHWTPKIGVSCERFFIQKMKTKWGSASPSRSSIRLNFELVKKPPVCLEYLVVHELIHFLEPTHNERFQTLLNHHLPDWRQRRKTLNELPVRHEKWKY
ncbi:MAG: SprT family zinc-dependent metalloprotease [Verrucomicrobiota bacterium JB023]|nr:SprT family zinc-dependent metalloprotease [Verrucomicrobiota bacterium JB023]